MISETISVVLCLIACAVWFNAGRVLGKMRGRRLGFKEGVKAVKIVHNEAVKADIEHCQGELSRVFAEIESCIEYIEEQLEEVPDCFDALKSDIEHIKSEALTEVALENAAAGACVDEDLFDFLDDEDDRAFIGGEIVEPLFGRADAEREAADGSISGEVR